MASQDSDKLDYIPWVLQDSGESDYDLDNYDYDSLEVKPTANDDDKSVKKVQDHSHSSRLCSALYDSLQHKDSHSDVVVIIDDKKFPAHKAVLSCACEYFKNMLSASFVESTSKEIKIAGDPQSFAKLLKFIYTGHFSLSASTVAGVFKMAAYMVFNKAMAVCAKYLFNPEVVKELEIGDCFEVWCVAKDQKFLNLTQMCHTRVMNDFPMLCDSEVFLEGATVDLMLQCLDDDEIETNNHDEEKVLRGAIKWLKYKWDQRKEHTTKLMKKIRLGLVPIEKLKEMLLELDIPECCDMVDEIINLEGNQNSAAVPLKQSHPEWFAPRNFVTAPLSLTGMYFNYQSEKACYRLEKMKSVPQPWDTDDEDDMMKRIPAGEESSNYGFIVTRSGDLYVGGAQHWISETDDWPYQNNFFKYDQKENNWITLPPMEIQHKPEMFEHDGYIYSIGKAHSECMRYREEGYDVQRYHMDTKKWEDIAIDLDEEMYGIDAGFIQGRLLVLKRKNFILFDPVENKCSRVNWNRPADRKKRPDMFFYKGNAYLVRNFKDQENKRRDHVYKLECDFDQDMPSVTETEEVDLKEELGVDLNIHRIAKEDPRVCFTFDKLELGVSKHKLYQCPCHDVADDLSRFWGPLPW